MRPRPRASGRARTPHAGAAIWTICWRGHHAAMPYEDVAVFIAKLRTRKASSALALELCILTAARSGEILGMRWPKIYLDKKIWTVPADRRRNFK